MDDKHSEALDRIEAKLDSIQGRLENCIITTSEHELRLLEIEKQISKPTLWQRLFN